MPETPSPQPGPTRDRDSAREFAGFRLQAELGRGAMGIVYRARDPVLGRDVALKVVVGTPSAKALKRFEREGRVTAALEHPGIVGVHSSGVYRDVPYLAYELVEGARTLTEAFAEASLAERLALVRDAARAVGFAHSQGVVHRDLKPDNVLVDGAGRVRVADFGLALAQGEERLTKTGTLLGTPTHMSPEQVRGLREEIGIASDVWGLGVILYQALTGEPPFMAETLADLATAICAATPVRPRTFDSEVTKALESVCLKALSADPKARHANGEALAADLERAMAASSDKRRQTVVLAAGAVALVGALVTLGWWATASRVTEQVKKSPSIVTAPPTPTTDPPPSVSPRPAAGEAFTKILGSAEAGEAWAMLLAGDMLSEGRDVESDWRAAAAWYRRAAEAGAKDGPTKLAALLLDQKDAEIDAQVALWLERASSGKDGVAKRLLGRLYLTGAGVRRDPTRAAKHLQSAAQAGDVEAMRRLSDLYARGVGVPQSEADALTWTKQAAEGGDVPSMLAIGDRLLAGRGVEQDTAAGLLWYKRAVATQDPAACYAYARLFDIGRHVPEDDVAAARWLERAAQGGSVPAMRALGVAHQAGEGVKRDCSLARDWLGRAYAAGDTDAAALLGWLYDEGGPGLDADFAAGLAWLKRGVEAGSLESRFALARAHAEGRLGLPPDPERALVEYRECARLGSSPAMAALGSYYESGGVGGKPIDMRKAVEWYIRCAERKQRGERWVLHQLGLIFEEGREGIPPDVARALAYYLQAAKAGLRHSMERVGVLLRRGEGVGIDYEQGFLWTRRAAEAGSVEAMCDLGDCYLDGLGVEVNVSLALDWLERAGAKGHPWALERLGSLYDAGELVPEDPARAARYFERSAQAGNMQALADLGSMYLMGRGVERDLAKGRNLLERAGDGGALDAYVRLGDLYRFGRQVEVDLRVAIVWYRKAADGGDPEAMESLGQALLEVGQPDEGLRWLRKGAEESPWVWLSLGWVLRSGLQAPRDDAEATRCYQEAADAGLSRGMVGVARAYALGLGVGRDSARAAEWRRKAEQALTKKIEARPEDPGPLAERGEVRILRGDLDGALSDIEAALKIGSPDHPWALEQRAHVRLLQGDAAGSVRDATQSLEADPRSTSTLLIRAEALMQAHDYEAARSDCDAAIESGLQLDLAYALRGCLRALLGGAMKTALEDCDRGVKEGHEWLGRAHAYRGFVRSQAGLDREALADGERATALAPDDAEVWLLDARIREKAGDSKGAAQSYRRSLELSPKGHPRAAICRERLAGLKSG